MLLVVAACARATSPSAPVVPPVTTSSSATPTPTTTSTTTAVPTAPPEYPPLLPNGTTAEQVVFEQPLVNDTATRTAQVTMDRYQALNPWPSVTRIEVYLHTVPQGEYAVKVVLSDGSDPSHYWIANRTYLLLSDGPGWHALDFDDGPPYPSLPGIGKQVLVVCDNRTSAVSTPACGVGVSAAGQLAVRVYGFWGLPMAPWWHTMTTLRDQQNLVLETYGPLEENITQTFQPGRSGYLVGLEFVLFTMPYPYQPSLSMAIYNGTTPTAAGQLHAWTPGSYVTMPMYNWDMRMINLPYHWVSARLTTPIWLEQGQTYVWEMTCTQNRFWAVAATASNRYPQGMLNGNVDQDLVFVTYMSPTPEPPAPAALWPPASAAPLLSPLEAASPPCRVDQAVAPLADLVPRPFNVVTQTFRPVEQFSLLCGFSMYLDLPAEQTYDLTWLVAVFGPSGYSGAFQRTATQTGMQGRGVGWYNASLPGPVLLANPSLVAVRLAVNADGRQPSQVLVAPNAVYPRGQLFVNPSGPGFLDAPIIDGVVLSGFGDNPVTGVFSAFTQASAAPPATAEDLMQQNMAVGSPYYMDTDPIGQGFVVGSSGQLHAVELLAACAPGDFHQLTLELFDGTNDRGERIAFWPGTVSNNFGDDDQWGRYPLWLGQHWYSLPLPEATPLVANRSYYLRVSLRGNSLFAPSVNYGNPYPDGASSLGPHADMAFRLIGVFPTTSTTTTTTTTTTTPTTTPTTTTTSTSTSTSTTSTTTTTTTSSTTPRATKGTTPPPTSIEPVGVLAKLYFLGDYDRVIGHKGSIQEAEFITRLEMALSSPPDAINVTQVLVAPVSLYALPTVQGNLICDLWLSEERWALLVQRKVLEGLHVVLNMHDYVASNEPISTAPTNPFMTQGKIIAVVVSCLATVVIMVVFCGLQRRRRKVKSARLREGAYDQQWTSPMFGTNGSDDDNMIQLQSLVTPAMVNRGALQITPVHECIVQGDFVGLRRMLKGMIKSPAASSAAAMATSVS